MVGKVGSWDKRHKVVAEIPSRVATSLGRSSEIKRVSSDVGACMSTPSIERISRQLVDPLITVGSQHFRVDNADFHTWVCLVTPMAPRWDFLRGFDQVQNTASLTDARS